MQSDDHAGTLELVKEKKIRRLLGLKGKGRSKFEASGVVYRSGAFYVVFDNLHLVVQIRRDLEEGDIVELDGGARPRGYEGITLDSSDNNFYIVVESKKDAIREGHFAWVHTFDKDFNLLQESQLDFELPGGNKGFEGVAFLQRNGRGYLLALCEGNRCEDKKHGAEIPGGGRIQVFEKVGTPWACCHTLKLPESVQFKDYSGLDVHDHRIAVVSQKKSQLWVSHLHYDEWRLDEGQTYDFPRTKKGKKRFCNVEGVSWISAHEIVVVSDKVKGSKKDRCKKRDQSIHIFRIPDSSSSGT